MAITNSIPEHEATHAYDYEQILVEKGPEAALLFFQVLGDARLSEGPKNFLGWVLATKQQKIFARCWQLFLNPAYADMDFTGVLQHARSQVCQKELRESERLARSPMDSDADCDAGPSKGPNTSDSAAA